MWPVLVDMTKEECVQNLRNLELEAYSHLISALRAQGPLNSDKRKLLKDTSQVLNITQDRHKAEIRRAINDERLNTIAYHVTGLTDSLDDWAQEGRRTVPLLPRMAPQTAYSAIADETADEAHLNNKQLPFPVLTERKRIATQPAQMVPPDKTPSFRIPDLPKSEENKKRKIENSTLAQHLLGPPKISRSQQMIRQRAKMLMKEMGMKKHASSPLKHPYPIQVPQNGPKYPPVQASNTGEETIEQIQNEINSYTPQKMMDPSSNENQAPIQRPKLLTPPNTFKQQPPTITPGPSNKMCPTSAVARKSVKPTPLAQKLVMVSNAQTISNASILQKTLSIPLMKNLSMKNLEKFKIVTTASPQLTNSFKHKVMTVKSNPKKVIPLSQLLGTKGGIKVLPIGGKIVGKSTITTSTSSQPVYIVNTVMASPQKQPMIVTAPPQMQTLQSQNSLPKENGKSSVLGDILKASGVTAEDFDNQIEGFRIPNNHQDEDDDVEISDGSSSKYNSCVVLSEGVDLSDSVTDHLLNDPDNVVLSNHHVGNDPLLSNLSHVGNYN